MIEIRKGQAPAQLGRDEFGVRFRGSFIDPAFGAERDAIARLEEIAWEAYREGRKTPHTHKAGPGYADPEYELSVEWRATKERLEKAQSTWADSASPSRSSWYVALLAGRTRNIWPVVPTV